MDRAQFRRRPHVRLTLIADDLVRKPKFFQQPQHALGAGIVEVMDGEHGVSPGHSARAAALGGASRTPESRDTRRSPDFTRALLTELIYPGNIVSEIEEIFHESRIRSRWHCLRR